MHNAAQQWLAAGLAACSSSCNSQSRPMPRWLGQQRRGVVSVCQRCVPAEWLPCAQTAPPLAAASANPQTSGLTGSHSTAPCARAWSRACARRCRRSSTASSCSRCVWRVRMHLHMQLATGQCPAPGSAPPTDKLALASPCPPAAAAAAARPAGRRGADRVQQRQRGAAAPGGVRSLSVGCQRGRLLGRAGRGQRE